MAFTSFYFLVFVVAVVCAYYVIPKDYRWVVLLAASYIFYMISSPSTFVFLLLTTYVTFYGGKLLGKANAEHKAYLAEHKETMSRDDKKALKAQVQKKKRRVVLAILLINFGVLAFVKYFRYYIGLITEVIGVEIDLGILIPLGISFYTFQSAAYILDLYRNKIEADSSLPKFALFMSFFPQIVQGPIARYDQLAGQLYEGHDFQYTNLTHGAQLMLWGFFKKLVIADRVSILVTQVFDNYTDYSGGIVLLALLFYTIQIYADFSGGIDIARGVAQCMGIEMGHNFMRPYFSDSLSEFWRRWHMSLSFWCRDYIFYTIAMSKFFGKLGKKLRAVLGDRVGKLFPVIIAQMATFITIGLWHGAEFKYIAYGLYNGFIIVISLLLEPYFKKALKALKISDENKAWKVFRIIRTFCIVTWGRMFPKAASFGVAMAMYVSIFRSSAVPFSEQVLTLGLNSMDFLVVLMGCIVWFFISWHQEKGIKIRETLDQKPLIVRWIVYLLGFAAVLIVGIYGPGYDASAFIYRGF